MKLRLHNTLSGQIEDFVPIDENNVRMYVCGPTVYDRAHLGNARPAVAFDILYRILKKLYKNVTYVRNITDIDDKIYKASVEKNIAISALTKQTISMYHDDIATLNVLPATIEPKATEHIADMIEFIEKLVINGNAYVVNGHVYFDVNSSKDYGQLSKKNMEDLISGARVEVAEHKKNPLDFVLWKPIDDRFNFGWDSPWGKGRPGWHIECSAMSRKYLGETFDIHGGGADLIFPHHENEIAQSCALTHRKCMTNYWVHNGHLNINGQKMSKSLGNFLTVNELLRNFNGEVLRLAFLSTHYRAPMNFSFDGLKQAKNLLDRWYTALRGIEITATNEIFSDVFETLLDDMNTPKAISILCAKIDELNKTKNAEFAGIFVNTCQTMLGIMQTKICDWFCCVDREKQAWIDEKIQERDIAKKNKDFAKADAIRSELLQNCVVIEDTKNGTIWKLKK